MEPRTFSDEQRAEIKLVVNEALVEFFETKGTTIKNVLVTLAILVGAITVIFGGAKAILALIGFSYVGK